MGGGGGCFCFKGGVFALRGMLEGVRVVEEGIVFEFTAGLGLLMVAEETEGGEGRRRKGHM